MKKVWLAAALLGLVTMAASSFADVQNIRLSGDLRIRGYYLNGVGEQYNGNDYVNDVDNAFILQRTRLTVEADLEDHVLVVVTLKAEGMWGQQDGQTLTRYGTGMYHDRGWQVGVSEAYVQLSEMFFSPATLKLGRQYLHYGRGLHISSANETYNFDAGRLMLDFYPFTLDIVGAKLSDGNDDFPSATGGHGGNNLLFINGRYEMKDSIIKDVEAYFGWVSRAQSSGGAYYWPAYGSYSSPWIVGIRADLTPIKGLDVWAEATYEGGSSGYAGSLSAFLLNAGAKYTFKDVKMEPSINANYIYASGGTSGNAFVPFFPSVDGYNGFVFSPLLSNIHIFNLGASIKPAKNVCLSVQGYYYLKVDNDSFAGTDYIMNEFGGGYSTGWWAGSSQKDELAWEVDTILGYDYSKDVRFQLVYGVLVPDRGYTTYYALDRIAHAVRGEVNVKF